MRLSQLIQLSPGGATTDWPIYLYGLALVLLLLAFLWPVVVDVVYWAHRAGHSAAAIAVGRGLLRSPAPSARVSGAWLLAAVLADRGETEAAVEAVGEMIREVTPSRFSWSVVTDATNHLVNAGLYREAVVLPRRWPASLRREARRRAPASYALAQVNRAEALHNLGRNRQALRLLERVEEAALEHPLSIGGLRCLRAWICVQTGDLRTASRALGGIDPNVLKLYAPELRYTRATLASKRGRHDLAVVEAELGLACSRRAASQRNGHFVLGELALARGAAGDAVAHFERGIGCRYRRQGGQSLTRYAALLAELGDRARLCRIEGLILERDPQSAAAKTLQASARC